MLIDLNNHASRCSHNKINNCFNGYSCMWQEPRRLSAIPLKRKHCLLVQLLRRHMRWIVIVCCRDKFAFLYSERFSMRFNNVVWWWNRLEAFNSHQFDMQALDMSSRIKSIFELKKVLKMQISQIQICCDDFEAIWLTNFRSIFQRILFDRPQSIWSLVWMTHCL